MKLFSFNRNMNRWLLRDEDGNTLEPIKVSAYLGDKLIFTTESHLYPPYPKKPPEMGIAHGSMSVSDELEFRFE